MARTRPCTLPYDVICIIVDELKGDKSDLASCSLVCRDWLQPSQSRLFRDVDIEPIHQEADLFDFSDFTDFIASESSNHICRYIQRLTLRSAYYIPKGQPQAWVSLQFLSGLLVQLPALRNLELDYLNFAKDEHAVALLRPRRALDSLVIHAAKHCSIDEFDILNVISLFVDISKLHILWNKWEYFDADAPDSDEAPRPPQMHGPVRIRELYVSDVKIPFLSCIAREIEKSGFVETALDTVTIGLAGYRAKFNNLVPFFRVAGPCIRRLRLNTMVRSSDVGFQELEALTVLPLEACINLESLILVLDDDPWIRRYYLSTTFQAYLELLSRCVRLGLKRLIFYLSIPNDALATLDWAAMDRVASSIKSLQICRMNVLRMNESLQAFEEFLPELRGAGKLRAEWSMTDWSDTPF
ncbi:hypothetical protein BD414DRAFT_532999 [Trametes punicea]|nr:hypothetical protein BD414DRAFT_532999 [Trametes punicea]